MRLPVRQLIRLKISPNVIQTHMLASQFYRSQNRSYTRIVAVAMSVHLAGYLTYSISHSLNKRFKTFRTHLHIRLPKHATGQCGY